MDHTLFDTSQLLEFIRTKSKFIQSLEKTIQIYRNNDKFVIMDLIKEYINSEPNTQTKYSIIHKKNTIISTCRFIYGNKNKKGYFNLVYTNPTYRGLKICQNHLKQLIDMHKDTITTFELYVDVDNIPAKKCYENIGFSIVDKHKGNVYLMRLQI